MIAEELKGVGATSGLSYEIINQQMGTEESKKRREKIDRDKKKIEELWKRAQTHIVVATLIATISFAAGFTMPGGYIQSGDDSHEGMSVLATKSPAFGTLALLRILSTTAILTYFLEYLHDRRHKVLKYLKAAVFLNLFAILAMTVAFVTGVYAVLATSPALAISVCVAGSCFFLFYIVVALKYVWLITIFK